MCVAKIVYCDHYILTPYQCYSIQYILLEYLKYYNIQFRDAPCLGVHMILHTQHSIWRDILSWFLYTSSTTPWAQASGKKGTLRNDRAGGYSCAQDTAVVRSPRCMQIAFI